MTAATAARPLDGVTVVDLTQILSGPFATMLLADLGARVLKVEPPGGDPTRGYPPYFLDGDSAYFHSLNRNKESWVLDLRTHAGQAALHDLVRGADVVVSNVRPSARAGLGCDYETLKGIRPDLIFCSITGFGEASDRREEPAYDLGIQAYAGAMSLTGEPGRSPLRMGVPMGDLAGAMYAALAILAALIHRSGTGEGQHLDIGLLPSLASLHTYQVAYLLASHHVPEPLGSGHTSIVPFQAFATADGHVCAMAPSEKFWRALCGVVNPPLAEDRRFATAADRLEHREELARELSAAFATRPTGHWVGALHAAGVPAAPVNDLAQALEEPEVARLVTTLTRGEAEIPLVRNPIAMSGTPLTAYRPAPALDDHPSPMGAGEEEDA